MTPNLPDAPQRLRALPRKAVLKLTLLLAVVLSVLLGVFLTAGHRFWREVLREQIDARLSSVATSRRDMVQAHVSQLKERAVLLAEHGQFRGLLHELNTGKPEATNRAFSQNRLNEMADGKKIFSAVLADAKGQVLLADKGQEAGGGIAGDPAFENGMSGPYIGLPRRVGEHFEVVLSVPVRDYSLLKKNIGVLVMSVEVSSLATALRDTTGLGQTGEVILGVREKGHVRYLFPPRFRDDTLALRLADEPVMVAAIAGHERLDRNHDYRGEPVVAAGGVIGYGGWGLVAKMDEAEAYEPITRALRYGLGLGAFIAIAGLIAAFGLARHGLAGDRAAARPARNLSRVQRVCALAVLAIGLTVLAGWVLEIEILKTLLPGLASMKPNTAIAFVLAGVALAWRDRRSLQVGCAVGIMVLGGLSLAQDWSGRDFGTDQLFLGEVPGGVQTSHAGRMSPVAAGSFVVLGGALLMLTAGSMLRRTMEALVLLVGLAALLALIGYAYNADALYALNGFTSMALPTAFALVVLTVGILAARTDGLAGALASSGLGGQVARRFLPLAIFAPTLLGWLVHLGGEAGLFSAIQSTVVLAALMVVVMAVLVWRNALSLEGTDAERTSAEAALRESEERWRATIEAIPPQVWTARPDGTFEHVNQRVLEYFAVVDRSVIRISGTWQSVVHPDDLPLCVSRWAAALCTGEPYDIEFRLRRFDGVYRWHLGRAVPVRDAEGNIRKWFGTNTDITEVKLAGEKALQLNSELEQRVAERVAELAAKATLLEEKAAELELASRYKSEFLSNMSHELRTPLNSILIFSQNLALNATGNLTGKQVELSQHIHSSGNELLELITDILDLAKIESGTVTVWFEEIRFTRLSEMIERNFRHLAEAKSLPFHVRFSEGLPAAMESDAKRLQQILKNLLSNALKFTASGKVEVRVDLATQGWSADHPVLGKTGPVVAFAIEDTGIGVAPEKQRLIFEAFRQADAGTARNYGGTGLGLAISRDLAALLGGEIALTSAEGKGSIFTLFLPVSVAGSGRVKPAPEVVSLAVHGGEIPSPSQPLIAAPDEALRGRKVLVVDDDVRNIFALTSLLENFDMEMLAATNGRTAVEIVKKTPDLSFVLMDIMMPEMDGYETMREIREIPEARSLVIFAVTAKAMTGDREKCLKAGASDYLPKPVNTEQLVSLMRKWMGEGPSGGMKTAIQAAQPGSQ